VRLDFDLSIVLTYYHPHLSGLTEVARVVGEGLAERGWRVAVVASQHDPGLPLEEVRNGLTIYRAPVLARIGRGVISPALPVLAGRVVRRSAVANFHLPMLEAGPAALLAGGTPIVCNHHDDVWVSGGLLAGAQVAIVERSVRTALSRSTGVVVNNLDHAHHSRHWPVMRRRAVDAMPPPCHDRGSGKPAFRETDGVHVGFLGRIAPEKGLQHLVDAFQLIPDPRARLLLGGDHLKVAGGSVITMLRQRAAADPRIRILGLLTDDEVADLYASSDVFALTSVAEESFGIAQAEAMIAGVPVVASDLPGMRVPVETTGFGALVPVRDPAAIKEALLRCAALGPDERRAGAGRAAAVWGAAASVAAYEAAFRRAAGDRLDHSLRV
jgi:glycosyltransferase involved in cell wall biosynthesis